MMHRMCGHETMLMNMALDPEWVKDMVMTYIDFNIMHFEVLFEEEGLPQSTWIAEDLGYKNTPFMSPAMFEDIMLPGLKKMVDYFHAEGLKVILHSCGFIEPLLPGILKTGIDCLEGMEWKAGMDIESLYSIAGDSLVYFGNFDIRVLESNDFVKIDQELARLRKTIEQGARFIIHSDHSISPQVEYETYRYFVEKTRELI